MREKNNKKAEDEMYRIEVNDLQRCFHMDSLKYWRPGTAPGWRILRDLPYKDVFDYLEQKTKEFGFYEYEKKESRSPIKNRVAILKRDNYHCTMCGCGVEDGVKLEIGHIVAHAHGGSDEMDNLRTMCFDCNRGLGTDSP